MDISKEKDFVTSFEKVTNNLELVKAESQNSELNLVEFVINSFHDEIESSQKMENSNTSITLETDEKLSDQPKKCPILEISDSPKPELMEEDSSIESISPVTESNTDMKITHFTKTDSSKDELMKEDSPTEIKSLVIESSIDTEFNNECKTSVKLKDSSKLETSKSPDSDLKEQKHSVNKIQNAIVNGICDLEIVILDNKVKNVIETKCSDSPVLSLTQAESTLSSIINKQDDSKTENLVVHPRMKRKASHDENELAAKMCLLDQGGVENESSQTLGKTSVKLIAKQNISIKRGASNRSSCPITLLAESLITSTFMLKCNLVKSFHEQPTNGHLNYSSILANFVHKGYSNKLSNVPWKKIVIKNEEILQASEKMCSQMKKLFTEESPTFKYSQETLKKYPQLDSLYKNYLNDKKSKSTRNTSSTSNPKEDVEILTTVRLPTTRKLPPAGELKRCKLPVQSKVFVLARNVRHPWQKGTILFVKDALPATQYKVKLDTGNAPPPKLYNGKQLAYVTPPDVILPVGTRVVARFCMDDSSRGRDLYSGIVGEIPKSTNRSRYLIFFEDQYTRYVEHDDVFVVLHQSPRVEDDLEGDFQEFIVNYLKKYPERAMAKVQVNQSIQVKCDDTWRSAKIISVDCSLVKFRYEGTEETECIYRGSVRIGTLYKELKTAEMHRAAGTKRRHNTEMRKLNQPYVEYSRDDIVTVQSDSDSESKPERSDTESVKRFVNGAVKKRNTARKSTAQPRLAFSEESYKSKRNDGNKLQTLTCFKRKQTYEKHRCGIRCKEDGDPAVYKGQNPFMVPILFGWERHARYFWVNKRKKIQSLYKAPCGRYIRNKKELQKYLVLVQSMITIDFFSFDSKLIIFRQYSVKSPLYYKEDITGGKENIKVPCVNTISHRDPPRMEYSAERFAGNGVFINLDPGFLVQCECTDNCQSRKDCPCQMLTVESYAETREFYDVGYSFRRLHENIVTGLYECNHMCKCNSTCTNRVVQNKMQVNLQMFKTRSKGWGIRCLHDIEAGQFICIYAGKIMTDQRADEEGNVLGDEYMAELDHMEVAERMKDGYESDVPELNMEVFEEQDPEIEIISDSNKDDESNHDSDFEESILRSTSSSTYATRSQEKPIVKSHHKSSSKSTAGGKERDGGNYELPDIDTSRLYKQNQLLFHPLSSHSFEMLQSTELSISEREEKHSKATGKKTGVSTSQADNQVAVINKVKHTPTRIFFYEDFCYTMDAKIKGNIGRYLNHSCEPNVFVQNVFIDTHDLRFPTVAFFAFHNISAGTELTWDYNYEIGSVEGKILYCQCGSKYCRGRLL